jgi:hypothetical protein
MEAEGKAIDNTDALLAAIKVEQGKASVLLKPNRNGKPLFLGAVMATC